MDETQSQWRDAVKTEIMSAVDSLDDFIDAQWRKLRGRLGMNGVPAIQPYAGYANETDVWIHGRVLTNPPKELPSVDDTWWDNLVQTYRRLESDEVPGVEIEIDISGIKHRVISDEEGYFRLRTARTASDSGGSSWKTATTRIVSNENVSPAESAAMARFLAPPVTAGIGVISDIDDTILHTGVTNLATVARLTFLHNARSRKPLPGVGALYRGIQIGPTEYSPEDNPIFYVSSSPWNLYDLLEDFLDLNHIPAGPMFLRDLGFDETKFVASGHDHKLSKALAIMDAYPELPFVLFGDSGQEDARLYAEAAKQKPNQVKAIFIRDVDPKVNSKFDRASDHSLMDSQTLGIPSFRIRDSNEAAAKLFDMGLLSTESVDLIRRDVERDISAD